MSKAVSLLLGAAFLGAGFAFDVSYERSTPNAVRAQGTIVDFERLVIGAFGARRFGTG